MSATDDRVEFHRCGSRTTAPNLVLNVIKCGQLRLRSAIVEGRPKLHRILCRGKIHAETGLRTCAAVVQNVLIFRAMKHDYGNGMGRVTGNGIKRPSHRRNAGEQVAGFTTQPMREQCAVGMVISVK